MKGRKQAYLLEQRNSRNRKMHLAPNFIVIPIRVCLLVGYSENDYYISFNMMHKRMSHHFGNQHDSIHKTQQLSARYSISWDNDF